MERSVEMNDLNACEEKQCYRWSGIAALLLAIGYVAIIPQIGRASCRERV